MQGEKMHFLCYLLLPALYVEKGKDVRALHQVSRLFGRAVELHVQDEWKNPVPTRHAEHDPVFKAGRGAVRRSSNFMRIRSSLEDGGAPESRTPMQACLWSSRPVDLHRSRRSMNGDHVGDRTHSSRSSAERKHQLCFMVKMAESEGFEPSDP